VPLITFKPNQSAFNCFHIDKVEWMLYPHNYGDIVRPAHQRISFQLPAREFHAKAPCENGVNVVMFAGLNDVDAILEVTACYGMFETLRAHSTLMRQKLLLTALETARMPRCSKFILATLVKSNACEELLPRYAL
jgi:hypothetical protein